MSKRKRRKRHPQKFYRLIHKDENVFVHESCVGDETENTTEFGRVAYSHLRAGGGWGKIPRELLRLQTKANGYLRVFVKGVCTVSNIEDLHLLWRDTPAARYLDKRIAVLEGEVLCRYRDTGDHVSFFQTFVIKPTRIIKIEHPSNYGIGST